MREDYKNRRQLCFFKRTILLLTRPYKNIRKASSDEIVIRRRSLFSFDDIVSSSGSSLFAETISGNIRSKRRYRRRVEKGIGGVRFRLSKLYRYRRRREYVVRQRRIPVCLEKSVGRSFHFCGDQLPRYRRQ